MAFKLGSARREIRTPSKTPIFKKGNLREGVQAEANADGTIHIDERIPEGSELYNRALRHEMQHQKDMQSGRAAYGENWVAWEGDIFFRENGMIDGPAGRLPEGHPDHPWERVAIEAETNPDIDSDVNLTNEKRGESPYKGFFKKIGKKLGLRKDDGEHTDGELSHEEKMQRIKEIGLDGLKGGLFGMGASLWGKRKK